ncbi:Phosphatidylinositol 3-kinase C2 domain [Trinorchestia longiramus]|nr:Phosphatidylinositol 3-kinase C2 domain [Trinorchestia longiramus]
MELEVDEADVNDLVVEHQEELTTEELVELQRMEVLQQLDEEEEDDVQPEEILTSWKIKESCQLPVNMRIKINSVDKQRPPPSSLEILRDPILEYSPWANPDKAADLLVQCQVFAGSSPYSLSTQTSFVEMSSRWDWYEWLELPVLVCDLPKDSRLVFTVWDSKKPGQMWCIGTATVDVFDENGEMNTGKKDLRLVEDPDKEENPEMKKIVHRLAELDAKLNNYERGQTVQIDWMDRLAFREIGQLTDKLKKESGSLFLNIEFPAFMNGREKLTVLFYEQGTNTHYTVERNCQYCKLYDPSAGMENIIEKKHLALARSLRSGLNDRDIRPNAEIKKKLNEIMEYPPTTVLTSSELDLVWKHRYYLSEHQSGLTKFVKCINWSIPDQKKEAIQLLNSWAVLDAENALELLGPSFTVPEVRQYAVRRLGESSDEDLMLYLLQLVQALKYEPFSPDTFTFNEAYYSDDFDIIGTQNTGSKPHPASLTDTISSSSNAKSGGGLLELLVQRASHNLHLANSLYWFLKVECESGRQQQQEHHGELNVICLHALDSLTATLRTGEPSARQTAQCLEKQDQLVSRLVNMVQEMRSKSFNREQKVRFLKNTLADPMLNLATFPQSLPLPLDPKVLVTGIDYESVVVFKSALEPCTVSFTREGGGPHYRTIFKVGDDLRQDQLILQLITLMERLLLRENLDLKLTPYRVLATAPNHGFVQFIDAAVIADILREDASVLNYLRRKHADAEAPLGVTPQVLDNYIRSCAGYCIITYILGVGDRHHDNLMLTADGCFFHIDFGYILGRDPKPLPPLIKLSREITDGLGGQNSEQYQQFRQLCRTTFLSLRRHANLVLNLFSLMVDASIPDIALEPEKAVKKVEERFHLDLTDEQASSKILSVLHESANAVMGAVAENFHKFTQYIRN